ncbi:hypothetical protein FY136_28645 (plasmid) [Agrobacterium tumefaciens]|uniref:hypothetical protein n=1 Tax=Agrobacterium tumefaciens TaxID=358 RepID=UPI0021D31DA7|nr:hypothetical protein [Agrobacterium tumefaciens]UXT53232.1 hypothetical protein FY136_28645 [Agrobacterium tumefaciens]
MPPLLPQDDIEGAAGYRAGMYLSETDKVNNLTKLARHRLAARALARDPGLIAHAYVALDQLESLNGWWPALDEWRELLARPVGEVRRLLTARTQEMDRLRIDSPFFRLADHGLDFSDEHHRRRIWAIAKRVAGVSTRDEQWVRTPEYEAQLAKWMRGYVRPTTPA